MEGENSENDINTINTQVEVETSPINVSLAKAKNPSPPTVNDGTNNVYEAGSCIENELALTDNVADTNKEVIGPSANLDLVDAAASNVEIPPAINGDKSDKSGDSDSDNEEIISKKKPKRRELDSDSENEHEISNSVATPANVVEKLEDLEPEKSVSVKKKTKWIAIVDSDSDSDTETRKKLSDSGEENEIVITPHNKSFSDDLVENHQAAVIYNTNNKGELIPEISVENTKSKSKFAALYDSESSDEETFRRENCYEKSDKEHVPPEVPQKPYKKSKTKKDPDNPKPMTGKEAAIQRKEIKSESQRMVRESNVSLPYHKSKTYTIKEFLARRPKFASAVPKNLGNSPSVAIKMSMEQLEVVSKKLMEREKEVKEFYKSESEEEDEESDGDDKDYVPPGEENKENLDKNVESKDLEAAEQIIEPPEQSLVVAEDKETLMDISEDTAAPIDETQIETTVKELVDKPDAINTEESTLVEVQEQRNNNLEENETQVEEVPAEINDSTQIKELEAPKSTNSANTSNERHSLDYEFNLDDLPEENTEREVFGKTTDAVVEEVTDFSDLDKEIENFQLETAEPNPIEKKTSKRELIKEKLADFQPKLSGGPNDVIDLETGITKPNEISKLMNRFVQHTAKKNTPHNKQKVKLSIVSLSGGEIHEETVAMNVDHEDEAASTEEKPGAKYQKLRGELQNQIAQRRSEFWQQKNTKDVTNNEENNPYDGEKSDCGMDDDAILDDEEEEAELTDCSSEEEYYEEDCEKPQKPRTKSAFVDEEAEESDVDEDETNEVCQDERDLEEETADNHSDNEVENIDEPLEEPEVVSPKKKTLRRIVAVKDSDEEDEDEDYVLQFDKNNKQREHLDSTLSVEDDDVIPPNQPSVNGTPQRQITQSRSDYGFLTPVSYITGIQNLNSGSKFSKDSPVPAISPFEMAQQGPSPLKDNRQAGLHKKLLFSESESQIVEDIAEMCSGTFPTTQQNKEDVNDEELEDSQVNETVINEFPPSTQDLLNICSGQFTGVTQAAEESQKVPMEVVGEGFNANSELKSLDEDQDLIISQLLDEEELEKFKKKFISPVLTHTQKKMLMAEDAEEVQGSGGAILDSDDEDEASTNIRKKKKNQKKLVFSDEEDSDEEDPNHEDDEIIDLHDSDNDEEVTGNIDADNIGYDSEENEVELEIEQATSAKAKDFFENEAELSESEWGSADEDEKDLDAMEFEKGDEEKFDERQMKSDLERIHMRRLLDDDNRDVKLLQELLLEDGEMHGTGRQRQFKWKNIDSMAGGDEESKEDDQGVFLEEEEESEEQWRKRRHQREMFLEEKLKKSQEPEDDDLLSDSNSQLLKLGQKMLQRSQPSSQNSSFADKSKNTSDSPQVKQQFSLLNRRGSFLSRNDQVLQRLAEYNKVSSTLALGTAKNSRNFLFQTVSTSESSISLVQEKKRKAADGTPIAIKKLRLSSNLSPAAPIKKVDKPNKGKKLFENW